MFPIRERRGQIAKLVVLVSSTNWLSQITGVFFFLQNELHYQKMNRWTIPWNLYITMKSVHLQLIWTNLLIKMIDRWTIPWNLYIYNLYGLICWSGWLTNGQYHEICTSTTTYIDRMIDLTRVVQLDWRWEDDENRLMKKPLRTSASVSQPAPVTGIDGQPVLLAMGPVYKQWKRREGEQQNAELAPEKLLRSERAGKSCCDHAYSNRVCGKTPISSFFYKPEILGCTVPSFL